MVHGEFFIFSSLSLGIMDCEMLRAFAFHQEVHVSILDLLRFGSSACLVFLLYFFYFKW